MLSTNVFPSDCQIGQYEIDSKTGEYLFERESADIDLLQRLQKRFHRLVVGDEDQHPFRCTLSYSQMISTSPNMNELSNLAIQNAVRDISEKANKNDPRVVSCPEHLELRGDNVKAIEDLAAQLRPIIQGHETPVPYSSRELIESDAGRKFLQKFPVTMDPGCRQLLFHGDKHCAEAFKAELDQFISFWEKKGITPKVLVAPKSTFPKAKLSKQIVTAIHDSHKDAIARLRLVGRRCQVLGQQIVVDELIKAGFQVAGEEKVEHDGSARSKKEICTICGNVLRDAFTLKCRHCFCRPCLVLQIETYHTTPPLKCQECDALLSVKDLRLLCPTRIKDIAFVARKQLTESDREWVECCNRLCGAVVSRPVENQGSRCCGCCTNYCYHCTQSCNQLVAPHYGRPCGGAKNESACLKSAHDLLNTTCPECKSIFEPDFDACFALKCSCGAALCGFCMKKCGADAHAHVAQCERNPVKGRIFFPPEKFKELFYKLREEDARGRLQKFLKEEVPRDLRRAVVESVNHCLEQKIALELDEDTTAPTASPSPVDASSCIDSRSLLDSLKYVVRCALELQHSHNRRFRIIDGPVPKMKDLLETSSRLCHLLSLTPSCSQPVTLQDGLSPDSALAIQLYTQSAKHVNQLLLLRETKSLPEDDFQAIAPFMHHFLQGLQTLRRRECIVVYRGVGGDVRALIEEYRVGCYVVWQGVSSCSIDINEAKSFGNGSGILLEISLEHTIHIPQLKQEVIIAPNTLLEVVSNDDNIGRVVLKEVV